MTRAPLPPPNAEAVMRVLASLERHPAGSPASLAFAAALKRMGRDADDSSGLAALDALMAAVAAADPDRAAARQATLRAAWAERLPGVPRWPETETTGDAPCRT